MRLMLHVNDADNGESWHRHKTVVAEYQQEECEDHETVAVFKMVDVITAGLGDLFDCAIVSHSVDTIITRIWTPTAAKDIWRTW